MEVILKAEGLSKFFGGLKAVDNVDFMVKEGEFRSIIGPNGAGKTTLFNLFTGFFHCDTGKIFWKGKEITSLPAPEIVCLGIVRTFQRTNIFPNLSVWENVSVPLLRRHGKSWDLMTPMKHLFKQEIQEIIESTGLSALSGRMASTLSQGHQRCLELAIALANMPDLLLLAEPTAGMSVSESAKMLDLVKAINQQRGVTILFTEHDMNVVFSLSQKITVMHFGKIIAEGTPEEIRNKREVQLVYLGETD
jgi:branched-chain amino acid transport system ATP-binding protein